MIQFQKTYTDEKQSERLLKLGLPIDSADILLLNTPDSPYDPYIIGGDMALRQHLREGRGLPSWSVGRLMDIELICREQIEGMMPRLIIAREPTWVDTLSGREMLDTIIDFMEKGGLYDFSKLEGSVI
mgnify:CR=1 FL=1